MTPSSRLITIAVFALGLEAASVAAQPGPGAAQAIGASAASRTDGRPNTAVISTAFEMPGR